MICIQLTQQGLERDRGEGAEGGEGGDGLEWEPVMVMNGYMNGYMNDYEWSYKL